MAPFALGSLGVESLLRYRSLLGALVFRGTLEREMQRGLGEVREAIRSMIERISNIKTAGTRRGSATHANHTRPRQWLVDARG